MLRHRLVPAFGRRSAVRVDDLHGSDGGFWRAGLRHALPSGRQFHYPTVSAQLQRGDTRQQLGRCAERTWNRVLRGRSRSALLEVSLRAERVFRGCWSEATDQWASIPCRQGRPLHHPQQPVGRRGLGCAPRPERRACHRHHNGIVDRREQRHHDVVDHRGEYHGSCVRDPTLGELPADLVLFQLR